ncbi:CPCC family cysteine-rich protein [Leifsonia sp. LS-T14]|uniref:CPCC family cysteine-rich protein n=1 Tax=unclassified Leifsonia TaxID=2663824 RepID=UPI0035A605C0
MKRRAKAEPGGVVRGPNDDPSLSDDEVVAGRLAWFHWYVSFENVYAPASDRLYSCPCCGHLTLKERAGYEICGECWWEDDGQDDHDSHVVRGGPNGSESLDAARARYVRDGGVRLPHQPPTPPERTWIVQP